MTYTLGTLFSGIGVPDLCGRMLGMTTLWQVEIEAFPRAVLAKNFPEAVQYQDIFDCHHLPHVDVLVAGFPCQPFSVAGKRQGEKDPRYLVPEMLRVIHETQPRICLLENVPGFASLESGKSFRELLRALAEMGYDAEWGHLTAEAYGAPHRRERWFCVAYPRRLGRVNGSDSLGEGHVLPDQERDAAQGQSERQGRQHRVGTLGQAAQLGDAERSGQPRLHWGRSGPKPANGHEELGNAGRTGLEGLGQSCRVQEKFPDADHPDLERLEVEGYTQSRLGRVLDGATHWLDGFVPYPAKPGEQQYVWEPAHTLTGKHPDRVNRIKALGNSMAVDVIYDLMRCMKEYLDEET